MLKIFEDRRKVNFFLVILFTVILFITPANALIDIQIVQDGVHTSDKDIESIEPIELYEPIAPEFQFIGSSEASRQFPKNHPMNDYSDVLVIVNNNSAISKQIGQYFKGQRNIPDKNMCFIDAPTTEIIDNITFHNIRKQVEDYLVNNNLTLTINYFVTTKGVPLRIYFSTWQRRASFDSELGLILGLYKRYIDDPDNTQIANPYYQSQFEFSRLIYNMYLVTRLTGFNFSDIKQLIDNAAASADLANGGGTFFFNRDPAKQSSNTYRQGNTWLELAHVTMQNKGLPSARDFNTAFQTDRNNVAGYVSWGGFDSRYLSSPTSNRGFDADSSAPYGVPDGWFFDISNYTTDHIEYNRTINNSAFWSINITRDAYNDTSYTAISQNITPVAGVRYYMRGLVKLYHVTSTGGGGAFMQIKAFNSTNDLVWVSNGTRVYNLGIDTNWRRLYQVYYDPIPGVTKLTISVVLNKVSGSAYFDDIGLYEIKPRHSYIPGAIAEVYGYGTAYTFDYDNTYYRFYNELNIGELIRDGITGVKGYVDYNNPYIESNTRVYTLFDAYTAGYNLAESFWMATPYVSWTDVVIGDPKCAPYFTLLPDLGVGLNNITFSNEHPNQGDSVLIDANVENWGGSSIYNFNVSFRVGKNFDSSKVLETKLIPFLGAGENQWVNITWDTTKYKVEQTIWIELDPDYNHREQNEDNNIASKNITINAYPFNLELKSSMKSILRGGRVDLFVNISDNETAEDQLDISISIFHNSFQDWQKLSGTKFIDDHWQVSFTSNRSSQIGWYDIMIGITDDNLATFQVEKKKVFEVLNNAPLVSDLELTETTINRTGKLMISFKTDDYEDSITSDMLEIFTRYESESFDKLNEPIVYDQLTDRWQIEFTSNISDKLGKYDIKVVLTDSDGSSSMILELDVFEILNNPPEIERVTIDKPSINRGKFATIYIYGADLETQAENMELIVEQRQDFETLAWSRESFGTKKWNPTVHRWEIIFFTSEETLIGNYSFRAKLLDSDSAETEFMKSESILKVLNNPPVAVISVDVFSVNEDEFINFDGSTSSDYEDLKPVKFHWDFGDGTESNQEIIRHSFPKSGEYIINLTVTDKDQAQASIQVTVTIINVAPVASITVGSDSTTLKNGQKIIFDGRESYDTKSDKLNLTYNWDFGDGNTSELANTTHIFSKPGTYILTLTITDDDGLQSSKMRDLVIEPSDDYIEVDDGKNDETPWYSGFGLIIIVIVIIVIILLLVLAIFLTRRKKKDMVDIEKQKPMKTLEADILEEPEFTGRAVGDRSVPGKTVKKQKRDEEPITATIDTKEEDIIVPEVELEFAPDMKKTKAVSAMSMSEDSELEEREAIQKQRQKQTKTETPTDLDMDIHLPSDEGKFDVDTEEYGTRTEALVAEELPEPGTKVDLDGDLEFVPPKIDLSDILEPEAQPVPQHRQEIIAAKERGVGLDFDFKKPSKQKKK